MPLEVIQRLIGLLIGGFLPTDKQVNHILTPYMTYFYALKNKGFFQSILSLNRTYKIYNTEEVSHIIDIIKYLI